MEALLLNFMAMHGGRIVAEKEEKEAAAKQKWEQKRECAKQKKAAVKLKKTVAKQKKAVTIQSRTQSSKAKQMFKSNYKATLAPPLNPNSTSSDLSEEDTISSEEDDGVCE